MKLINFATRRYPTQHPVLFVWEWEDPITGEYKMLEVDGIVSASQFTMTHLTEIATALTFLEPLSESDYDSIENRAFKQLST